MNLADAKCLIAEGANVNALSALQKEGEKASLIRPGIASEMHHTYLSTSKGRHEFLKTLGLSQEPEKK